jgi:hypothetical protein
MTHSGMCRQAPQSINPVRMIETSISKATRYSNVTELRLALQLCFQHGMHGMLHYYACSLNRMPFQVPSMGMPNSLIMGGRSQERPHLPSALTWIGYSRRWPNKSTMSGDTNASQLAFPMPCISRAHLRRSVKPEGINPI